MSYTFRTLILPAAQVPLAQALAAGVSGPAGSGMWTTGLSPNATAPATHYVSTGMIDAQFVAVLTDADALYAACQAAGASVTLAQCQALIAGSDVTDEAPFDAFARLGLQLVQADPT
jgi:hypothetical protein